MAHTITTKISTSLIEGEREPIIYKILSSLVQEKENVDVLIQSGLLTAIRSDIATNKGSDSKYILAILKSVLSHCKLSKYKTSNEQSNTFKEIMTLLSRKESKLTEDLKTFMQLGVPAKLYKTDGSISELQVVISKCNK
jgi:hypothetical protein